MNLMRSQYLLFVHVLLLWAGNSEGMNRGEQKLMEEIELINMPIIATPFASYENTYKQWYNTKESNNGHEITYMKSKT